jgi:hypothetical protein
MLSVPIGTSRVRRMETVLSKASVTARPTRSMLFPSRGRPWNRLRRIVSRRIQNSLAGTEDASRYHPPKRSQRVSVCALVYGSQPDVRFCASTAMNAEICPVRVLRPDTIDRPECCCGNGAALLVIAGSE